MRNSTRPSHDSPLCSTAWRRKRVKAGRLHRIHRGVYAVGHRALSQHGHWMAAVLACGEGAVLSHTDAATLWGFLAFCARHSFPPPEANVKVGKWEVDFLWREQRVAVETDFFDYHRGSVAFEDDHQRELDLRRAGLTVAATRGTSSTTTQRR